MGSKEDMHAIIQALLSTKHSDSDDIDNCHESTYFSDSIFGENLLSIEVEPEDKDILHNSLLGRNTIGFHKNYTVTINRPINKGVIHRSRSYNSFFQIKDLIPIKSPKKSRKNNKHKVNKEIDEIKNNQEKIIDMLKNINKAMLNLHERVDSIDICINKSFYST